MSSSPGTAQSAVMVTALCGEVPHHAPTLCSQSSCLSVCLSVASLMNYAVRRPRDINFPLPAAAAPPPPLARPPQTRGLPPPIRIPTKNLADGPSRRRHLPKCHCSDVVRPRCRHDGRLLLLLLLLPGPAPPRSPPRCPRGHDIRRPIRAGTTKTTAASPKNEGASLGIGKGHVFTPNRVTRGKKGNSSK